MADLLRADGMDRRGRGQGRRPREESGGLRTELAAGPTPGGTGRAARWHPNGEGAAVEVARSVQGHLGLVQGPAERPGYWGTDHLTDPSSAALDRVGQSFVTYLIRK
ncbi:hypothetical protein DAERI_100169 [Deinococcus aerius]|uniref:Uncharacterized protein n=1 Tax=Deinococcus aerius TaxID=200253 RepID=A0A2I9D7Q1_9DEIO|nr:hypothetical protein DAERI_100169 [Deinococcus aerius]